MSDTPEQARAYAEGFRDARAACHALVLQQIDGDSQCDGMVSRIAEDIERLPGLVVPKPGTERMTGLCTDKVPCAIATELRRALSEGRSAALEQAAELCDAMFFDHYDHSQRKVGAQECAKAIRALKTEPPK